MPTNTAARGILALGQLKPGANFATVSVAATANFTDLASVFADSLFIQANPGNTQNIYICTTAVQPDTTAYVNVLMILAPGGTWSNTSAAMNSIKLGEYYVGSLNNADFAIAQCRFR